MRAATIALGRGSMEAVLQRGQVFAPMLAASFRAHMVFFVLMAFYLLGLAWVVKTTGISIDVGPSWIVRAFVGLIIPTTLLSIVIMRFWHMVYHVRPKGSPTIYLARDIWEFMSSPKRLLNAIPMIAMLVYFILCFSTIKDSVPRINPFSWDVTFMELDRLVHFGVDPWRLLHPVLGYAPVTFFLNIVYNVWFVVVWVSWVAFAFADRQSELRMQYLVAYFLSWSIAGSLLAVVFSSAGPVYYGNLDLGDNPYAPLMSYLRDTSEIVPLWAVNTQDLLWQSYLNDNQGMISGISAMPSMHNTAAAMIAFLGWRINRAAGIAGTLFAFFIFLGSVHLGWHYAIDAYLGIAIAAICWWGSGHFARWYMKQPFVQKHTRQLREL